MNKHNKLAKELVNTNNELCEKLTSENKKYYEDLLVYIRTAGLFYDDYEIENLLMQILQDIMCAQDNGESAEDFFGKSPKIAANELIHNLGKSSKKETLKLVGLVFGISSLFTLMSALSSQGKGINVIVLILNALLSFLFVKIVFIIVHKSIYTKVTNKKLSFVLFLWLPITIAIGLYVFIELFTPPILVIQLQDTMKIFIIAILLIVSTTFIFIHNKRNGNMWSPFLPFIWILGAIGICQNVPLTRNWMASSNGKIITTTLTILGAIIFWVLTYFNLKDNKE
ncbi:hypothetical protein [Clostridium sp.]|jgi:uncharacterized membrane-anchored protein|uniref:hypothetical protein n=1 Tax=Clostridium sp. TaxID=1506 RepID=UPI003A5BADC5